MHSKHGLGSDFGGGGLRGPSLQVLPTHFYVCFIIRPLCREAREKFMSAALWSFTRSRCLDPPPFSPQKRSKKRQWKNASGREMPLSLSLFGMSTELLLFCVSLGILGCFCPPSFSRESLWIAVFTWGLEKAVIGFPPCGEGCFLGQLVSCLLHKDPGAAWSDWWRKSPCPQLLASVSTLKLQSLLSLMPRTHAHLHQFPSHPPLLLQPHQSLGETWRGNFTTELFLIRPWPCPVFRKWYNSLENGYFCFDSV